MNSYSLYVHLACGMSGLRQVLKSGSDILLSTLGNKYRYQWHRSSKNDLKTVAPCHSRCGTLKNPHCSMAMSAEYRSTFAALHRQWWRLHRSKKFLRGTKNSKIQPKIQGCFLPNMVEPELVVQEKMMNKWKVDNDNDVGEDRQRTNKLVWPCGSGKLKPNEVSSYASDVV